MIMEQHLSSINELKKKVDELSVQAEEAQSLKYQIEEYKHAIEKMQHLESTLEKYRRKIEDTSELKRQIKVHSRAHNIIQVFHAGFYFRLWKSRIRAY